MKHLTVFALLISLLLTACGPQEQETTLSPEERTDLYETAIEAARDQQTNDAMPLISEANDDAAQTVFEMLNLSAEDMSAYAISASLMNVKAYAIAAIYPAAGKEDSVLESLRRFVSSQQQSFKQYLADQYEIAVNTRLETLEDGTVLLVMSENQDALFDSIRDVIERGK